MLVEKYRFLFVKAFIFSAAKTGRFILTAFKPDFVQVNNISNENKEITK